MGAVNGVNVTALRWRNTPRQRAGKLTSGVGVGRSPVISVSRSMPKISNREAQRRRAQSSRDRNDRSRLLFNRAETAKLLGISVHTVIRLENDGALTALKLRPSENSITLYKASQVLALAGAEVG